MRIHATRLLFIVAAVSSCDDGGGPSTEGRLVLSTTTGGSLPDRNGYLVTVDDVDTLALPPSGTAELDVPAGEHHLRLLGVSAHCSVTPGAAQAVTVEAGGRSVVSFAIDCPATGLHITTRMTGLDLDSGGYLITVDGVDRRRLPANGTTRLLLGAGNRTITVAQLASNCELEGSRSRAVTILEDELVPLELGGVCTATRGVVRVMVAATGADVEGEYAATVDGIRYPIRREGAADLLIAAGEHVVALDVPLHCTVQTDPQSVTLAAGGLIRDSVEVSFAVSCGMRFGELRVTAQTTGTIPPHGYSVWICESGFYCRAYPHQVGTVGPNDTLLTQVEDGSYEIWLQDVPSICGLVGPSGFTMERETVDVAFAISCP